MLKGNAFFTRAWGDFDVEGHVPQHPSTIPQIASVSKQFTAAAILRLIEQDELRLDDRASRYIPELDARFDGVTIERASNQTYEQFLRDEFFAPFGLDETGVCGSGAPVPVGYLRDSVAPASKCRRITRRSFWDPAHSVRA